MRSGVRFAAWMPATRATASTSPFMMAFEAILFVVSGSMNTLHRASARRWVGSFGVTSTIRARPSGSRWVKVWSDTGRVYGAALRRAEGTAATQSRSAADLAHGPGRAHEGDRPDAMTSPLGPDGPLDLGCQGVVAGAGAQQRPQVELARL